MFVKNKQLSVRRSLGLSLIAVMIAGSAHAESVLDIGIATGFQDTFGGVLKKGRALIAADWDNDGRMDFYLGNPGNTSFFIKNDVDPVTGYPKMTFIQMMPEITYAWGGAAADYDNDGDIDLFVAAGGNECDEFDYLYQNQWIESGETEVSFINVAEEAGVTGPVLPGASGPVPMPTGNVVWVDYNNDGWVDLFANGNSKVSCGPDNPETARNTLWKNNADGTFSDVTSEVGLDLTMFDTRHSTFLDIENDGDWDLYEMNLDAPNVLWRNRLAEDGVVSFEDVTAAFSPGEEDVSFPIISFVSCSEDLNNDGFHDIVAFARGPHSRSTWDGFQAPAPGLRARPSGPDCSLPPRAGQLDHLNAHHLGGNLPQNIVDNPYEDGHALFINQGGLAFINEAPASMLNNPFEDDNGVMGAQIGDMNADGWIDVYVGNGGPRSGQNDQLFISDRDAIVQPSYINKTDLIDFPANKAPGGPNSYPDYPYRTHGTVLVDVDLDGDLELGVSSGGPGDLGDDVREPNRLFKFFWDEPTVYLKVKPRGNGVDSSRDGIGTRVAVTVSKGGAEQRTIHRTLWGGSCFSAQSGHELYFGLDDADQVDEVRVLWTNGVEEVFTGVAINSLFEVDQL